MMRTGEWVCAIVTKRNPTPCIKIINVDPCQPGAVECHKANTRDAVWDRDTRQPGAARKCIRTNACYPVFDNQRFHGV